MRVNLQENNAVEVVEVARENWGMCVCVSFIIIKAGASSFVCVSDIKKADET